MLNFEVRLQGLSLHFQNHEPADYDSYPDDFKSCIIGTMLHYEIGQICKVDKMILLVECRLFDRSRLKPDKIGEVQQIIRIEMHKLGSLLQLLNENEILRIKYKNGLDILLRENFDGLKMCFQNKNLYR